MKYVLIILLLNFKIIIGIYSQVNDYKYPPNFDRLKHENKIIKKTKKFSCVNKKEKFSVLFIFHLKPINTSRALFKDDLLLRNLEYIFSSEKKNKYPLYQALAYSDSVIAVGTAFQLYSLCNSYDSEYQRLLKFALDYGIDFMFKISGTNIFIYFGIKDKKIYVIDLWKRTNNIYLLDDFVNCCWNDLLLKE